MASGSTIELPRILSRERLRLAALAVATIAPCLGLACVRRTMKITTEPPNALVFLNDEEVGRAELSRDFLWYGDYDVVIRKKGFETLKTHWLLKRPWYQFIPLDFVFEVLTPRRYHDVHVKHFSLKPQIVPTPEDLLDRAEQVRRDALSPDRKSDAG